MTASATAKLYSAELLGLATELARFPLTDDLPHRAEVRSKTCGSVVAIGIAVDPDNRIERLGLRVSACAVGQAAAAIFSAHAVGCSEGDLAVAEGQIGAWLGLNATTPDWPRIAKLAPALPFPARHRAILLPWEAAQRALCNI